MAAKQSSAGVAPSAISVIELDVGVATCLIRGTSPLIFNRMAEKAKRELLLPKGRKTAADKAQNLKHNPVQEFRDSVYRRAPEVAGPTLLIFPAPAFKCAMATAALEVPGMKKAQIGRLVWVEGRTVDIYGIPELHMSVVRSADMNRTPDVRTRAILHEWACEITIRFARPTLTGQTIATLMGAAGMICGIGDFRQERGKGNYGQFRLVNENDEEYQRIMRNGGRKDQEDALELAHPYDADAAEMLDWYNAEITSRGRGDQLKAA